MAINEFYTRVLKTLDVVVEDDYLKHYNGEEYVNLTHKGVPLVLPTRNSISTMLTEDDSGNIVNAKYLFNPLDETVIKGDSVSLQKLKLLVSTRLGNRVGLVGSLLLRVAENPAHQTKSTMLINQFLVMLNNAKNPGMKQVVDTKTIKAWDKLLESTTEANMVKMLTVFVKKGGKLGTVKYNRVATFKFPLYEELCKIAKDGVVNGIKLRPKDVKVFRYVFEYLIEGIDERGIVAVGSNDKESPGFISLYGMYLKHMGKVQAVLGDINGVHPEYEDAAAIEVCVDKSELDELKVYKRDLASIPREGDVVKTKLAAKQTTQQQHTQPQMQQPNTVPQVDPSDNPGVSALKKAVYGTGSGIINPVGQQQITQQPVVPQHMMQQQHMQQPMAQQPVQQQPVYPQQPMQQPMVQQPVQQYSGMVQPQVSIGMLGSTDAYSGGVQQPMVQQPQGVWNR